nr:ATP-binding protein [Gemmatimonadaceae bacterium]
SQDELVARRLDDARLWGGAVLLAWAVALVGAAWRRRPPLAEQLAALGAAVVALAVVPLGTLSNASWLFDPGRYVLRLGPLVLATPMALLGIGLTAALAVLAVRRGVRRSAATRTTALAVLLALAGLGPFALRALTRGIALPPDGDTTALWLAWQLGLFLVAVAVLVAGAGAGRTLLAAGRGFAPATGPLLAAAAATLAPAVWWPEGAWPAWYAGVWIVVIGVTTLARRPRRFALVPVGMVAALGAAVLVWGAVMRQRTAVAADDTAQLASADADARVLLDRFAAQLRDGPPPRSRADLLEAVQGSDLAAAGYPVSAFTLDLRDSSVVSLEVFGITEPVVAAETVIDAAVRSGEPVARAIAGYPGVYQVLAVPYADGLVTTVLVEPRTRVATPPTVAALLGYGATGSGTPPYNVQLGEVQPGRQVGDGMRWVRDGAVLDGSRIVPSLAGPLQAHARVDVVDPWRLVQRGTLVVAADLGTLALLWLLGAAARGSIGRWWRLRRRAIVGSYRGQLTAVLFLFFLVPSAAFTTWSVGRLRDDERRQRELLVREFLRAVDRAGEQAPLEQASRRIGVPLLGYAAGRLVDVSDELFGSLAPLGVFLPPSVAQALAPGGSLTASATIDVAGRDVLVTYLSTRGTRGDRVVVAAPAVLAGDVTDRRREDLVILLFFSALAGALAALGLSGLAARQFARPIGALRDAAVAVARGERAPSLVEQPPGEFVPVFDAFRRMARDLRASERALEAARRRTDAVLRTVASGVVAVDADGGVLLANPRAEQLLGRGFAAGEALAPAAPALAARVAAFAAGERVEDLFEDQWATTTVQGRLTRLERGGVVVTLDDVTQLVRAQRVLAWGEMARQVAHEIKNPLTPMRLGVQHLRRARQRDDFDAILDRNVTTILEQIDRLDEIARTFSRYGMTPAQAPPPEPVAVAEVVEEVLRLERLGDAPIRWDSPVAPQGGAAWARRAELRDVLLNLLENARLAGAGRIAVDLDGDETTVRIVVRDDGSGIPAALLSRVFEPHFSTRTSGSGLGLAISRRLVEGWGGTLTLESAEGVGTTARIALRAVAADGGAPIAAE